eukprot:scaffold6813_cov123-Isochrysis_galbana.AAC.10
MADASDRSPQSMRSAVVEPSRCVSDGWTASWFTTSVPSAAISAVAMACASGRTALETEPGAAAGSSVVGAGALKRPRESRRVGGVGSGVGTWQI